MAIFNCIFHKLKNYIPLIACMLPLTVTGNRIGAGFNLINEFSIYNLFFTFLSDYFLKFLNIIEMCATPYQA
jgi:hypothetical protein